MRFQILEYTFAGLLLAGVVATLITAGMIVAGPRMVPLLMWRYLLRRRIAWVSLGAVTLCTMMVLVVISVMSGWVGMFRDINHGYVGDIEVYRTSLEGFDHYQEMIDQIKGLPEVRGAAPQVQTFALIDINHQIRQGVEAFGVDIKELANVNHFAQGLHLQPSELRKMADEADQRAQEAAKKGQAAVEQTLHADAEQMRKKAADFPSFDRVYAANHYRQPESRIPGIILGSSVVPRDPDKGDPSSYDRLFYTAFVRMTPLVVSEDVNQLSSSTGAAEDFYIVDDEKAGLYVFDSNAVYVDFATLQKELHMDPQPMEDADGKTFMSPARCNSIHIGLKEGADLQQMRDKIAGIVTNVEDHYGMSYPGFDPIRVETWDVKQGQFLGAVENERSLLVILFGIVSVVAIFLVFCIFYMIVQEKTRDIGIIKSVGATSGAIVQLFLGYGVIIGVIGGAMGLLLGYLIIHNINELHAWLSHHLGITIWDAKTYQFDRIPNTMEPREVTVIVTVAVLSAVVGAVLPAIRAGRMNPIEALRFE